MRILKLSITAAILTAAIALPAAAWASPIQWNSGTGNNGHWYEVIVVPQGITWDNAQAAALSQGGYLATVLSAEENAFVFGLVDSASFWIFESPTSTANIGPWIGGYQPPGSPEPGGGWVWLNADGALVYTNWRAGEPTNGAGSPHGLTESRLHYFEYGARGAAWNDLPDSLAAPIAYVVEHNTQPGTPVPEPGSLLLLATGVAAVGAVVRRRRRER